MISPVERFPVALAPAPDEEGRGGGRAPSLRRRGPAAGDGGVSTWLALLAALTAGAALGLVVPLPL